MQQVALSLNRNLRALAKNKEYGGKIKTIDGVKRIIILNSAHYN